MMVTTTLVGRYGNQCFQIAAAIGYARKHNMEYCIPEKSLDPNVWQTWFKFPVVDFEPAKVYKERRHCYTEIPKFDDVRLEGYFQTEKYFEHCRDEVVKVFSTEEKQIFKETASVHVRRGDYLLHPHLFPVLPSKYYQKAILHLRQNSIENFLVFSDDIEWCRKEFTLEKYGTNFYFIENGCEHADINDMSACEHNIISNSSFSWWGAYLNQNPNKIVVAPMHQKWFGRHNRHLITKDILPKEWIQIQF